MNESQYRFIELLPIRHSVTYQPYRSALLFGDIIPRQDPFQTTTPLGAAGGKGIEERNDGLGLDFNTGYPACHVDIPGQFHCDRSLSKKQTRIVDQMMMHRSSELRLWVTGQRKRRDEQVRTGMCRFVQHGGRRNGD